MATIHINFEFSDCCEVPTVFDVDSCLLSEIINFADEKAIELSEEYADNEDFSDGIICNEWYVLCSDISDCPDGTEDWDDFGGLASLDDWGEYIERVEQYGEAFVLRHADWSGHNDLDDYEGCWDSEEDFVQNIVEECYDIDLPSFVSVDWERTARDVMMDYSSYEGSEGYHIFSNH